MPFILELRDLWPDSLIDLSRFVKYNPLTWGLKWLEKFVYRKSQGIIAITPQFLEHTKTRGATHTRTLALPNGVDFDLIPKPKELPTENTFNIVFAGAHGKANGLNHVLDAAKIVHNLNPHTHIRITLIGDGPQKERLIHRKKEEHISLVSFLDPVPKKEIYNKLADAHACLMILEKSDVLKHGVSANKLFDYFASARPVIFSVNASNNPVEDAKCGITVSPNDPTALAKAMLTLSKLSKEQRVQMGKNGFDYAFKNFNFKRSASRLDAFLREYQSP